MYAAVPASPGRAPLPLAELQPRERMRPASADRLPSEAWPRPNPLHLACGAERRLAQAVLAREDPQETFLKAIPAEPTDVEVIYPVGGRVMWRMGGQVAGCVASVPLFF